MTGQIICHLGPPKTATTSLQIFLEKTNHEDLLYGGTFQPRERNTSSLSQRIFNVCSSTTAQMTSEQNALTVELAELLDDGKTIMISEEMFLVDQESVTLTKKLSSLRTVFADLPCCIVITVRDPNVALPSFYQETFSSLPTRLQLDFSAFCRDSRALCYDYTKLLEILGEVGFYTVRLIDFDLLSAGKTSLGELTGRKAHYQIHLPIGKHNAGRVGSIATIRTVPRVSLKSIGRSNFAKRMIRYLQLRRLPGYRGCVNMLEKVGIRKESLRELNLPQDVSSRLNVGYKNALQTIASSSHVAGLEKQ